MEFHLNNTLGVQCKNSCDYVKVLFQCLENDQVAIPLRDFNDKERVSLIKIDDFVVPSDGGGWMSLSHTPKKSDEIAQVSFTSGTEGRPKGILLSHNNLADVIERLNSVMALTADVREYIGVPVYHSFGYGRCRAVASIGGKFFIPNNGFDPAEISRMLKKGEINSISAVPSLWRIILANSHMMGDEARQVKWIEIGSQYMSAKEKIALRSLFSEAIIVQHYGLTEASRTTLLNVHEEPEEHLESVGRALAPANLRINEQGRIDIKGANVARRAIIEGDAVDLIGEDGWFTTSDLGEIKNGLLYYKGRADAMINCSGVKLSPEAIESKVSTETGVHSGYAICRIPDPMRGDGILISVTSDLELSQDDLQAKVNTVVESMGVNAGSAIKLQVVDQIPVSGPGKVQRNKLSADYQELNKVGGDSAVMTSFVQLIAKTMRLDFIDGAHSFRSLGGDSLSYIAVSMVVEHAIDELPDNWETLSFNELESMAKHLDEVGSSDFDWGGIPNVQAPPLPKGDTNLNPEGISFWQLVKEDLHTHDGNIFAQGFWAVFVNRFGNWRMSLSSKVLRMPMTLIYHIMIKWIQITCGVKLDYTVELGRRVKLEHFGGMILGARKIGNETIIRQNTTLGIRSVHDLRAKPTIENNVDIGAGAVIVGNITIGANSIVGANSVVFTNVPPNSVVMGNPARIISMSKN